MPALSERQFTRDVIKLAQEYGWTAAHFGNTVRVVRRSKGKAGDVAATAGAFVIPDKGAVGFPDLVLCRERVLYAELKVGKNRLTPAQKEWVERLRQAGQEVYEWWPRHLPAIEYVLENAFTPKQLAAMTLETGDGPGDVAHARGVLRMLDWRDA